MKDTAATPKSRLFLLSSMCSLLAGLCQPVLAQELIVVALANTQAPGVPEGTKYTIQPFRRWSVNAVGQVVFKAVVDGPGGPPTDAIYFGFPGELSLVAMENDPAPGTIEAEFCTFDTNNPGPSTIASADGKVAFMARALNTNEINCAGLGRVGIWVHDNGVSQLLALEGEQAADSEEGVIYSDIRPNFRHSNQGTIFLATLFDTVAETTLGSAIMTGTPGNVKILALIGDSAPGLVDKFFAGFINEWPHNNTGQSTFFSWFNGAASDQGIYRGDTTLLELVWKSEANASDFLEGYTFKTRQLNTRDWGLNDAAHACFSSKLDGPDPEDLIHDTVWRDLGATRSVVASTANPDPGITGFEFTAFSDCWINHTGQVLFRGVASSTTVTDNRDGLWLTSAVGKDPLNKLITYNGDVLFDGEDQYDVLNTSDPLEPHVNRLGSVAFEVNVVNPNPLPNSFQSIWLSNGDGEQLLALGLHSVTLNNQQQVTLGAFLDFGIGEDGSGNEDGNPSAISDNDQVVFKTTVDGVDAILLTAGRGDVLFSDGFEDFGDDP
jgi:hypothetical protein